MVETGGFTFHVERGRDLTVGGSGRTTPSPILSQQQLHGIHSLAADRSAALRRPRRLAALL